MTTAANSVDILLMDNPEFKFVSVVFAPYTGKKEYSYKTFFELKEEDFIIVETPSNGLQVVQVRSIIDPADMDFEAGIHYKWVVCPIDLEPYKKAKALEKELRKTVNRSKSKRAMVEAREQIFASLGEEEGKELKALVRL